MEMLGNRKLAITQQQAWDALNDPETLKKCVPGCDRFELTGDNEYTVGLAVKIGPVSAKFNGRILLCDVTPPLSYTMKLEGQGGAAGFANGEVRVALKSEDPGTRIEYSAQAPFRSLTKRIRLAEAALVPPQPEAVNATTASKGSSHEHGFVMRRV